MMDILSLYSKNARFVWGEKLAHTVTRVRYLSSWYAQ